MSKASACQWFSLNTKPLLKRVEKFETDSGMKLEDWRLGNVGKLARALHDLSSRGYTTLTSQLKDHVSELADLQKRSQAVLDSIIDPALKVKKTSEHNCAFSAARFGLDRSGVWPTDSEGQYPLARTGSSKRRWSWPRPAGCTKHDAMMLVDYVYGRPVGVPAQEVGGVALTLASLCTALNLDQEQCGEMELERVWLKIDQIRAKEAKKKADSALPGGAVVDHIGICPSCKARIYTAHPHICNKHQAPVVAA